MNTLVEILINSVNLIFDCVDMFLSSLSNGGIVWATGSGVTLAFALGMAGQSNITDAVLAGMRRWHGSIDDKYSNIDNLVKIIQAHIPGWTIPDDLYKKLTGYVGQLQTLIAKCRTTSASQMDRQERNVLLKTTIDLCLLEVKTWAFGAFSAGTLTANDIHKLGFLLPGESGGHRDRTIATDVKAEVKVTVLSADVIRVTIDQSAGENAAMVAHGWPPGVKHALIVIVASDGKTEIFRMITTRLHNDIDMPEGSHGKQYILKASVLKHTNDTPRFGNEPTFSMPLTTEDLAAALDRQRLEIERLEAEMKAKK
ncbi:MAG: hypothetical protein LBL79_13825 [Prevotella sp.]|jgi:hypothetical protein|nr:hypothetical protein [Prevotella sp.]